jgi:hypothetical protein
LDLEEMIQNLEGERRRIDEALEVLRRLHRARKSAATAVPEIDSSDVEQQLLKKMSADAEK